jgi:hypothetical protein
VYSCSVRASIEWSLRMLFIGTERSAGYYNGFEAAGIEFFNRTWTIEIESKFIDSHDIEKAIEG